MLTICPTPIGNLDDVTPRQIEVLSSADLVACEDTRTTGKLFELLGIDRSSGTPRFVSYHEHNEQERTPQLIEALERGDEVVLVSDAGTPTVADPGFRLVRAARMAGVDVTVLPGPVAAVVGLAGAGLPTDRWMFEGFAPSKSNARREVLERARDTGVTTVFYESPRRVVDFLEDLEAVYGRDHEVCVARELTKRFEEWLVGGCATVREALAERESVKGELVVVVGPAQPLRRDDVDEWIEAMLEERVKPAKIKAVVARTTALSKSEVFDRMERLKGR